MYYGYFSNFARRKCNVVPVPRVVEFKMATGCKFLSLAASGVEESQAGPNIRFGFLYFSNFMLVMVNLTCIF